MLKGRQAGQLVQGGRLGLMVRAQRGDGLRARTSTVKEEKGQGWDVGEAPQDGALG